MKLKSILLGLTLGLFSITTVVAGGSHGHGHSHAHTPVNKEVAKTNASKIISASVKRKKLDASWSAASFDSVEKKIFKGNPEWVVTFFNTTINDPKKNKLYIFLTLGGEFIAANHSGK